MIRQLILFSIAICLPKIMDAQKKNVALLPPSHAYTKKELQTDRLNHNCIKRSNKTFTSRLKYYPFNVASSVQLVSFDLGKYIIDDEDSIKKINNQVLKSKLNEVKTLTLPQIDKLTDILFNYGFRGDILVIQELACYDPRNGIVFLDKNNKVVECIEICFECRKTVQSSEKIAIGEMCDQKLDMLKNFFKEVGIEYGTIKE